MRHVHLDTKLSLLHTFRRGEEKKASRSVITNLEIFNMKK